MAEATASNAVKEVVTKKIVKVINLVLTEEEAQALHTVCNLVGGNPQTSRRRHFDAIGQALRSVFGYQHYQSDINATQRRIWFNDEEVKA